jgi:hypothetical protein
MERERARLLRNQAVAVVPSLKSETEPGGRFETHEQRLDAQRQTQLRLQKLLPPWTEHTTSIAGTAIISSPMPQLIRAGEQVADVLEEMQAQGLKMPAAIKIVSRGDNAVNSPTAGIRGAITGKRKRSWDESVPTEHHLTIEIPERLPDDVSLNDAAEATFGIPSDVSPQKFNDEAYSRYDKFAVRTFRDVVIHEMGHVQAPDAGGPLPGSTKLVTGTGQATDSAKAVVRAAMRVSEYASTDGDEFLAEAFTRLYRGETLPADSQALYDSMNGPKVPTR